jgi:hypothetical protein
MILDMTHAILLSESAGRGQRGFAHACVFLRGCPRLCCLDIQSAIIIRGWRITFWTNSGYHRANDDQTALTARRRLTI